MFLQDRFQEMGFMVKVDGVDVGEGSLEKGTESSSASVDMEKP